MIPCPPILFELMYILWLLGNGNYFITFLTFILNATENMFLLHNLIHAQSYISQLKFLSYLSSHTTHTQTHTQTHIHTHTLTHTHTHTHTHTCNLSAKSKVIRLNRTFKKTYLEKMEKGIFSQRKESFFKDKIKCLI